jgi:hypothetical protein
MAAERPRGPVVRRLRSRRARSWLHLLVVVPIVALVALFVLVSSPAGNRWLLRKGVEAADMFLPGASLEVGDLETDVLRHIRIRGLRLVADDGHTLAEVASLELLWQPLALLRREVRVDRLILSEPVVALEVDPEGRVDLLEALGLGGGDPEPDSGPWEGSPISVRVDRVHVVGGRVDAGLMATEGPGTRVALDELELALSFGLSGRELAVERAVLAAQVGYQAGETEPAWLPVGLAGNARLVDRPEGFPLQDLLLEDLRLQVGSAVAGGGGRLAGLGGTPRFELELALRDLFPGEWTFLTGELGVEGPFSLELGVLGPTEALELQATLNCPQDAGALRLGLGANLDAPQLTWRAQARLDAVQPHRFVAALTEPYLLHGGLFAEGVGTAWPDDLVAELGLALEPGVVHGVALDGLSVKAQVGQGQVQVEQLAFASDLGRGDLKGRVDPTERSATLGYRVERVPLARLARFGVSDLEGLATAAGSATLSLGDSGLDAVVDGQAGIGGGGYGGLVRADTLNSPFTLRYAGGALQVEGSLSARAVSAQGAAVARAEGPWRFDLDPQGAMGWRAELVAGGVRYGVLAIAEARAAVDGVLPLEGPLELRVGFDASGLEAPSSVAPELRAERAAGRLALVGDALELVLQARQGERPVLEAELAMDLATGRLDLPSLLVAPTAETTWRSEGPVRATIADGGLHGLLIQLRSDSALLWAMGDFDPSGPVDLRVMAADFTLDPLVPIFPGLPRGLEGTTRLALQVSGTADALALAGSVEVEGVVVPGSVRSLDARLVIDGDGRDLGFQLDIPEPARTRARADGREEPTDPGAREQPGWASTSMISARGRLPIVVAASGVTLDPSAPWSLDLLLAPGDLRRLAELVEVEDIPQARASAHARVGGTSAASTIALSAAAELPVGEDDQLVRLELDLHEAEGEARLELVVSQHMLRQAELVLGATTGLPGIIADQSALAFGAEPPAGPVRALDDLYSWVDSVDASLVPLGISTDVLAQFAPLPDGIQGDLVGGLRVTGDPLHPQVAGALQLVDARAGEVGLAPALVSILPADGGYDLGVNLGFEGGGSLTLAGFAPLEIDLEDTTRIEASLARQGLDLTVGGAGVPLAALVALATEADEVEGMVRIGGRVRGSLLDPVAQLTLALDDGRMTLPDLGVRYEQIALRAGVDGKLVELDELRIRSRPAYGVGTAAGGLELTGSAMLDGWVPDAVDLHGEADGFWAIDTSDYSLKFSGDFEAGGRWPALELTGDVAVAHARFVLDKGMFLYSGTLELDPRLHIERGAQQALARPVPPPPFYKDMRADLELDLARAATVKVEMPFDDSLGALYASALTIVIETRVDGLLDVGFADLEPSVLGEVTPVWGRADILGARFALGEGNISFVGGDPFDPILNLEAVHSTAQYGDVSVDITGSLADMGLGFRSDEYPDETDIVSILLTGAPLSSGDDRPGFDQALFNAALGAVMGQLESQGGSTHVVDMVELDTESVKLGRSFGDNIFVTLERRASVAVDEGENLTEVTVDWSITRSWNAEFVTGDQGTSSADLYWTWRF